MHRASFYVVSALLDSFPGAIQEENTKCQMPLHLACQMGTSMDVIQLLLDKWLEANENRNNDSVESLRRLAYGNTKILLFHVSSLFHEEQNTPSPSEILSFFINGKWWNGALVVVNRYPAVTKTLDLNTTVMADFLSTIGKSCSLTTMSCVIQNEPDLLEGV
uniref:Uncharacterized protein n=2 Tax=Ditylum brightwellii TaxID=49249 RepID=A0A7S4S0H5_9STRA